MKSEHQYRQGRRTGILRLFAKKPVITYEKMMWELRTKYPTDTEFVNAALKFTKRTCASYDQYLDAVRAFMYRKSDTMNVQYDNNTDLSIRYDSMDIVRGFLAGQ